MKKEEIENLVADTIKKKLPDLVQAAADAAVEASLPTDEQMRQVVRETITSELKANPPKAAAGGAGAGESSDLGDRVANIEHLMGIKAPLRKIEGLEHPTSLPENFTQEGQAKEAAAREKAQKNPGRPGEAPQAN